MAPKVAEPKKLSANSKDEKSRTLPPRRVPPTFPPRKQASDLHKHRPQSTRKDNLTNFAGTKYASGGNSLSTKYDTNSGQVFHEAEVSVSKRQTSNWIGELQTPSLLKRPTANREKGPRKLFDMAKGSVARNMGGLTAEHFSDVPWVVAEKVWREITDIRSSSFHAWRTFAASYGSHFTAPSHRYRIELKQPPLPLPAYFAGLTSPVCAWLTALRIAPEQASASDLVRLASLTNLAVLDLSDGQHFDEADSHFDERILRAWKEGGTGFQHLRVFMLGWQAGVDKWIFPYLDVFPNLEVLVVTDCAKLHQKNRPYWEGKAKECGWTARHAKKSAKSLKPVLNDQTFYRGTVGGMLGQREKAVLEAWLGSPKTWTHVIDDFPGLRTVWFDRVGFEEQNAEKKVAGTGKDQAKIAVEANATVRNTARHEVKVTKTKTKASAEEEQPTKRPRDVLAPTSEMRGSPPAKRTSSTAQRRLKIKHRAAAELLAEFGH